MSKSSFSLFRGKLIGAKKFTALKAFSMAEKAHEGVFRKDGVTPYIEHPVKVAALLFELGIQDDNVLAVAILHDVIEDTTLTKADLTLEFGKEIAEAVSLLSKPKNYDNRVYYENIKKNKWATVVKLADRTHNLTTFCCFTEEKKLKYINETKEYIYPLIRYAQHTYYEYNNMLRMFDLWIESIVNNVEPYLTKPKSAPFYLDVRDFDGDYKAAYEYAIKKLQELED